MRAERGDRWRNPANLVERWVVSAVEKQVILPIVAGDISADFDGAVILRDFENSASARSHD